MSTVGSVVVTNLTTGKRLGSLDKAEVIHFFLSKWLFYKDNFMFFAFKINLLLHGGHMVPSISLFNIKWMHWFGGGGRGDYSDLPIYTVKSK